MWVIVLARFLQLLRHCFGEFGGGRGDRLGRTFQHAVAPAAFLDVVSFAAAELVRRGDFAECHVAGFTVDPHKETTALFPAMHGDENLDPQDR